MKPYALSPEAVQRAFQAEQARMVELAARAMNLEAGRQRGMAFDDDWDEITEQERGGWRLCARAGLAAALHWQDSQPEGENA